MRARAPGRPPRREQRRSAREGLSDGEGGEDEPEGAPALGGVTRAEVLRLFDAERAFERDVRRLLLPALVALDPSVAEEARKAREEAEAREAAVATAAGKLAAAS